MQALQIRDRYQLDVTAIITATKHRNEKLKNLLVSMMETKKTQGVRVVIGYQTDEEDLTDEDKAFYFNLGAEIHLLPLDYGISATRNYLVKHARTPFVLLLEDDFIFTKQTNIEFMYDFMKDPEHCAVGALGGEVRVHGKAIPFEFDFKRDGDLLSQIPNQRKGFKWHNREFKRTDSVMNFTLFRRAFLVENPWDNSLKVREHMDFYLRAKATVWEVVHTDAVSIDHDQSKDSPEYRSLKSRDEYLIAMMKKHGINKIRYLTGSCRELAKGKILRYKQINQ